MARQTRSAVHGIGTSVTPSGRRASMTASTTAGVDAIVPASPPPLTPSGVVVDGGSVRSVTNVGRAAAGGIRQSATAAASSVPPAPRRLHVAGRALEAARRDDLGLLDHLVAGADHGDSAHRQ